MVNCSRIENSFSYTRVLCEYIFASSAQNTNVTVAFCRANEFFSKLRKTAVSGIARGRELKSLLCRFRAKTTNRLNHFAFFFLNDENNKFDAHKMV